MHGCPHVARISSGRTRRGSEPAILIASQSCRVNPRTPCKDRLRPLAFGAAEPAWYDHPYRHAGNRRHGCTLVAPLSAEGRCRMIRIRRILYATDFSSYSNQAYFHAVALAEVHRAQVTILYVYNEKGGEEDQAYWRSQLEQIRPVDPGIGARHVFLLG